MIRLSQHFTLEEFLRSATAERLGLSNQPNHQELANLHLLAQKMERVRALLKAPILVSSGFRSAELNAAVDGSPTSSHCDGLACDFTAPAFGSVVDICVAIAASTLMFDQLIYEKESWVHIGFDPRKRRQVLTIKKDGSVHEGLVE